MVPGWHKSFGDIIPFSINSHRRRRNKEANRLAGGAPTRGPGFLTWAAHWTHSRFLLLLPDIIFFKASQAFPMCTQMQPLLQALFLKHLLMRLPYLSSTILCWSRSSTCVLLLTAGLGRFPGEGNDNRLQYACLEIPWTEETGGLQSMGLQKSQTQFTD